MSGHRVSTCAFRDRVPERDDGVCSSDCDLILRHTPRYVSPGRNGQLDTLCPVLSKKQNYSILKPSIKATSNKPSKPA